MIRKSDKLVEATMLALQGKLELKENRVSRKTKKSEGIDVNVDNTTTVSVEGNETIVDTEDATVIVSKKEDEFVPETSDDLPMEAPVEEPVVDAPVAPDEDIVEVPADDTVMPEEVVDEPVDTELPEDTLGESKDINNIDVKTINVKGLSNAWKVVKYKNKYYQLSNDEYTKFVDNPEKFLNTYMIDGYRTLNSLIDNAKNDAVLGPLSFKENKKLESVEIEVSDDGKEVEVTTDNGEEVEVKDETPDENEEGETENTETEVSADDEPSIDEMIEENKKVEKVNTDNAEINNAIANPQLKANREKIRKAGYETDKKSVTNPRNGRTFQTKYAPNKDKIDWRNRLEKDKTDYEAIVGPENDKIPNSRKISQRYNTAVYSKADADAYGVKYGPKGECDKVVEDTEEYLEPRYDSRASFYKKAKVVTKDNGDEELYSYGTHVGGVRGGKPYSKGRFSQTTSRHQKEFFKQRGIDPNKVDVEECSKVTESLSKARAEELIINAIESVLDKSDEEIVKILKALDISSKELQEIGYDEDGSKNLLDLADKYNTGSLSEGKQADRNEEEIKAKKSHCINCENKQRSAKVQEMIARRQKKSEALNKLNKTLVENRENIKAEKVVENKDDLGINEEVPKKEEPVPNTAEANLKVENKFSSKSFNEALTKYYKDRILAVESVEVTKLSKTRTGLKLEANLLSKSGKLKRAICLEMKQIQTGKSFDKYEVIETKGLVKENKSDNTKTTMTTFTNKQNIIECRYILTK